VLDGRIPKCVLVVVVNSDSGNDLKGCLRSLEALVQEEARLGSSWPTTLHRTTTS